MPNCTACPGSTYCDDCPIRAYLETTVGFVETFPERRYRKPKRSPKDVVKMGFAAERLRTRRKVAAKCGR